MKKNKESKARCCMRRQSFPGMQEVWRRMIDHLKSHGSSGQAVNMTSLLEAEGMDIIGA